MEQLEYVRSKEIDAFRREIFTISCNVKRYFEKIADEMQYVSTYSPENTGYLSELSDLHKMLYMAGMSLKTSEQLLLNAIFVSEGGDIECSL